MFSVGLRQLMVLAMMRAQVVLPTPRGPQNRKACAKVLLRMAFFRVLVMEACPTTVSKVTGLYFLADTTKFSISGGVDLTDKNTKKPVCGAQLSTKNGVFAFGIEIPLIFAL